MTDFQKNSIPIKQQRTDDFSSLNAPSMKLDKSVKNLLEPSLDQRVEFFTNRHHFVGKLKDIVGNPDSPTLVIEDDKKETYLVNFNHIQSMKLNISETQNIEKPKSEKYIPVKQPNWD